MVSTLEGDGIGYCEKDRHVNMCLILSGYRVRVFLNLFC
jgi:hypothetical protein